MLEDIELNGITYNFEYIYNIDPEKADTIICSKLIDDMIIQFGMAYWDSYYNIVRCSINYWATVESPYIDIERDKKDFTEILNIAKKELLEINKE